MNRIRTNVNWQCSLSRQIGYTASRTSLKMQISAAYVQALKAFFLLWPKTQTVSFCSALLKPFGTGDVHTHAISHNLTSEHPNQLALSSKHYA